MKKTRLLAVSLLSVAMLIACGETSGNTSSNADASSASAESSVPASNPASSDVSGEPASSEASAEPASTDPSAEGSSDEGSKGSKGEETSEDSGSAYEPTSESEASEPEIFSEEESLEPSSEESSQEQSLEPSSEESQPVSSEEDAIPEWVENAFDSGYLDDFEYYEELPESLFDVLGLVPDLAIVEAYAPTGFIAHAQEGDEESYSSVSLLFDGDHELDIVYDYIDAGFDIYAGGNWLYGYYELVLDSARALGYEIDVSSVYLYESSEDPDLTKIDIYLTSELYDDVLTDATEWDADSLDLMNDYFGEALPFMPLGSYGAWEDYSDGEDGNITFYDYYLFDLSEDYIDLLVKDGFVYDEDNESYYKEMTNGVAVDVYVSWGEYGNMIDVYFEVAPEEIPELPEEDALTTVLTAERIGASGTEYKTYNYESSNGVKFAFQCAGGNSCIQIRSKNSTSGIVVTENQNGLVAESIDIVFYDGGINRDLSIYGSNEAFEISNMYGSGAMKAVDTISFETGKTVVFHYDFEDDYSFLGFRSKDGAIYIQSMVINWAAAA